MLGLETALRLSQSFDAERLQKDLEAIKHISLSDHPNVEDYKGSWSGIALVNVEGRIDLSYSPDEDEYQTKAKYQKTEILNYCPYLNEIIDSFPCQKYRVRLLSLAPKGIILEHTDEGVSVDGHLIRLHIPIVTHSQVFFFLGMERCLWQPGELWYGDFTFPHHIKNFSPISRVHMVIDFPVNSESLKLLPSEYVKQKKWRKINRKLQQELCKTKRNLLEMTKVT